MKLHPYVSDKTFCHFLRSLEDPSGLLGCAGEAWSLCHGRSSPNTLPGLRKSGFRLTAARGGCQHTGPGRLFRGIWTLTTVAGLEHSGSRLHTPAVHSQHNSSVCGRGWTLSVSTQEICWAPPNPAQTSVPWVQGASAVNKHKWM